MPEGNHHQESKRDDALPDHHTRRLPGTKIRDLWKRMRAHPDDICKPGKNGEDVPGRNQTRADVGDDRALDPPPQRVQAKISAETNERQAEKEDDDLNKTNHGAAIPAEVCRFRAHHKNEKTNEDNNKAESNSRRSDFVSARRGGNRRRCGTV